MKRQFLLAAAMAAALMLGGCDAIFGSDQVIPTVTGPANVRDAPTTDGSKVIARLEAGTELKGNWVEMGSGPRDKWLEFDFNGKKAFVWAGNLKISARDNSIVSPNDKSKSEVAESDKSQDSPTQSLELAPGVYSRSEICRSEDSSKQCANQPLFKSLCESIESINDYYLESSARVYSMAGWINVPNDAIRHLIDNDQVLLSKVFMMKKKPSA
jgi:hypothetical protein